MPGIALSVVSILGMAFSLVAFAAPITTFRRIMKKKSTEGFSDFPYLVALYNCLIYMWYGSPMVSHAWDNVTVFAINGVGLLFETTFLCIFHIFAAPENKKRNARSLTAVVAVATTTVAASMAFKDQTHRKIMVGSVGMAATVLQYGAPLSIIRMVIATKSSEFIPVYLSITSLFGSCSWLAYGALMKDVLIMAPNFLGLPLAIAQIGIYLAYLPTKQILAEDGIACELPTTKDSSKPPQKAENESNNKAEERNVPVITEILVTK